MLPEPANQPTNQQEKLIEILFHAGGKNWVEQKYLSRFKLSPGLR